MGKMLQDFSPQALIAAIEANMFEFFTVFSLWRRAEAHDDPDMLWTITDVPFPLFNSVMRARLQPEDVEPAIRKAIARCKERDVPLLWWTGPATRPADLGTRLTAHGFDHEEESPGMAADLQPLEERKPASPGLSIQLVSDLETLEIWGSTLTSGFEMPSFIGEAMVDLLSSLGFGEGAQVLNYLARLDGEPVGTSTVFFGAGVAGIYNVATVPAARRRGIGAAMTLAPLYEARARGCRIGVLLATSMGLSVYAKLGFREYCKLGQYVWQDNRI